MKKISLSLLVVLLFIFALASIAQAFQNEPDGFRGLKWGDPPTEDMVYLGDISYAQNTYHRKGDKLGIGSATLNEIRYKFNFYSYQFHEVFANFTSETDYKILKIIFEGRYGKPTYIREGKDSYFLQWIGDKAEIRLYYDSKEYYGWFFISSKKIREENPEGNKQKEVEKAKEDF